MIVYENLDGFVKLLDALADKNTPVYVVKRSNMNENLILTGSVVLQFRYDDDVAMFTYKDHIDAVQLLNQNFLNQLKNVVDNDLMEKINNAVKAKLELFNGQLENEYQKAVKMLNGKGFSNVLEASLV